MSSVYFVLQVTEVNIKSKILVNRIKVKQRYFGRIIMDYDNPGFNRAKFEFSYEV